MPTFVERRTQPRPITKDIVVLYHGSCSDGFGAAWAAWKKFGDQADYVGVEDHNVPPEGIQGKEVYLLDFMYNEPALKQMLASNHRVTGIDHHVSAKVETEMTFQPSYALDHSGAVLAWRYFHPGIPEPELLLMIEAMDLWKLERPNTRELFAYLDSMEFDFQVWSRLAEELDDPVRRADAVRAGSLLVRHENHLVNGLVSENVQLIRFEGYEIYAINSPLFRPELGHALSSRKPPMAVTWYVKGSLVCVSLRSDGTVDVAAVAKKYGGGGHRQAAGFTLDSLQDIPWKPI